MANENVSPSTKRPELLFGKAVDYMDKTIEGFLVQLSDPEKESLDDVFERVDSRKDPALALVLKMVQLVSNLRAGKLLIDHGFVYELGTIRRMVYETVEDVMFLLAQDKVPGQEHLHPRFLNAFYAAEKKKGPYLSRRQIRGFLNKLDKEKRNDSTNEESAWEKHFRRLYDSNSEFVHGRARRIMRLYDKERRRFRTQGIDDGNLLANELTSFWQISFLAMYCFAAVRAGFRREDWQSDIWKFANTFYEAADLDSVAVEA